MSSNPALEAPDATFVRHRWIKHADRDWAKEADRIMREYGAVTSGVVYTHRHQARWRAQKLIRLMVELSLHERWQLAEHTDHKDGGWIWTVEYKRRS
jgi:hypothetical protein